MNRTPDPRLTPLQTLTFANLELRLPEELYWRLDRRCWPELARPRVNFRAGGSVSSDTFYNGLTVDVWKRVCDVSSLVLRLRGRGSFVLTFGVHRLGMTTTWLSETDVELGDDRAEDIEVPCWREVAGGMLFFRLRARGDAVLDAAAYLTADTPLHDVRLGIVITHFNRQPQVAPAVARIARELLDRGDLEHRIDLTIVDNSRNLVVEPHPRVTQVPNRNLGGTGGFVRGLLALKDGARHTHALFMDDDASCETESIARTLAVLRFCRDPTSAIAGSLLRELAPWQLIEKGARFDGQVRALGAGLDMRSIPDLLEAERIDGRPDYGAWWFFAFPIDRVRTFPFPFFVRGDDIHFGLANRFRIETLNGVGCVGEDFSAKHGPLTAYLDARYHLVHALFAEHASLARIAWIARQLFVKSLASYHYSSARAVTLALRHVTAGPDFFRDHIDLQSVRAEIAGWTPSERLMPIVDRASLKVRGGRMRREGRGRRLLRALTLQGFLLPNWLILDRTLVQPKGFHGRAGDVFRFRRVLYENAATGVGYLAQFERRRFFSELRSFLVACGALVSALPSLRRAYSRESLDLTTEEFWRGVYASELSPRESSPDRTPATAATAAPVT